MPRWLKLAQGVLNLAFIGAFFLVINYFNLWVWAFTVFLVVLQYQIVLIMAKLNQQSEIVLALLNLIRSKNG